MLTAYEQGVQALTWGLLPPEQQPEADPAAIADLPIVRDDDDLDRVLRDYMGVKLPHLKCCDLHQTPWDAFHDAFFARSVAAIWKASRGLGGKSFTLAALGMAEALFLRADVNVLGGSGEQSKRILESIGKLWDHPQFPRDCMTGSEPSATRQVTKWGNRVVALMASTKSVRGPHPQRLRLDEVDEIKQGILEDALGQPMAKGGIKDHVVGASTHQYPDGTMTRMIKRAQTTPGWRFFEWCYRENLEPHGWLSQGQVDTKKALVSGRMWNTEYEGQEPSSEGRAIDTGKLEAAFQLVDLADLVDSDQTTAIIEGPDPEGKYGTGTDWAKKVNHTVVVTIRKDVRPMRVVAVKRTQKEPWPSMAGHLDQRVKVYGGTSTHDNTGVGAVVHDLLHHPSDPFNMVGRDRADLLSEYIAAIEKGDLVWPRIEGHPNHALAAAYSEHKYAVRDDVYKGSKDGTGKHHLPDTISAGALAWRAASQTEAAGALSEPESGTPLQDGFPRGRLSEYIGLRRRRE
jgi:hypothetical protein